MPWKRPTLPTLYKRVSADFSAHFLNGQALPPASVLSVLAKVWAGACHTLHGFLDWIFVQALPDTAENDNLLRWAAIWDVYPKEASFAKGHIALSGASGAVLPAGSYFYNPVNGQRYKALADSFLDSQGAAVCEVVALTSGPESNLEAGDLNLVAPQAGVKSKCQVLSPGIYGGTLAEDDNSLRDRMLLKIREPPHGGAKHDYVQWALQVPGVTRAWPYPLHLGLGTVGLTFLCDNATYPQAPLPDVETIARVQAHVDSLRPATALVEVFAPEAQEVIVSVALAPFSDAVCQAVQRELYDLWQREAAPGCKIPLTHIAEAISISAGEYDHRLLEPTHDVVCEPGVYPMLKVVFSGQLDG